MNNGADIKQLMQMTIGQIQQLEDAQTIIHNVIDRQKKSVSKTIEQEKIDEHWAEKFLEELNGN